MTEHTLTITDELIISESLKRGANNMKTSITDDITISVVLDSAYKIKRAGDIAFIRSHIY